jgi:DNA-binding response OmpR family regulator
MPKLDGKTLDGKRILVVEDDYLVALDIQEFLEESGAFVIGPAPTLKRALELVEQENGRIDAAVLDINLRGERSFPVADRLSERGVAFVFTTGYQDVPEPYARLPRCEKPVDKSRLLQLISG